MKRGSFKESGKEREKRKRGRDESECAEICEEKKMRNGANRGKEFHSPAIPPRGGGGGKKRFSGEEGGGVLLRVLASFARKGGGEKKRKGETPTQEWGLKKREKREMKKTGPPYTPHRLQSQERKRKEGGKEGERGRCPQPRRVEASKKEGEERRENATISPTPINLPTGSPAAVVKKRGGKKKKGGRDRNNTTEDG